MADGDGVEGKRFYFEPDIPDNAVVADRVAVFSYYNDEGKLCYVLASSSETPSATVIGMLMFVINKILNG